MNDLLTLFDYIEANVDASAETYAAYIDDCRALAGSFPQEDVAWSKPLNVINAASHTNDGAWASANAVRYAAWEAAWYKATRDDKVGRDEVKERARIAQEIMVQRLIHLAGMRFGVEVAS